MADYTNRQLAQVIAGMSKELQEVALKNTKSVNDYRAISTNLGNKLEDIREALRELKNYEYKPDFNEINEVYRKATSEAVNEVNKGLKTSDFSFKLLLAGIGICLLGLGLVVWGFNKATENTETKAKEYAKANDLGFMSNEDIKKTKNMYNFIYGNKRLKQDYENFEQQQK